MEKELKIRISAKDMASPEFRTFIDSVKDADKNMENLTAIENEYTETVKKLKAELKDDPFGKKANSAIITQKESMLNQIKAEREAFEKSIEYLNAQKLKTVDFKFASGALSEKEFDAQRLNILNDGFKEAQKNAENLGKEVNRTSALTNAFSGVLKGVTIAAAAASAAAGGLSLLIVKSMNSAEAFSNQAKALNTTAKDLRALQHAAELSGVSGEKLTTALETMTLRLGQATSGSGTASKALKQLKITTAELDKMSTAEKIDFLTKKIKESVPASQQAAVAAELFGSQSAMAMMSLEGDTIKHATEQINKFRVTLSEVEYKQIEQANSAIKDIKLGFEAAQNQLAAGFAPAIKAIADLLGEATSESGMLKEGIVDFAEWGTKALGYVGSAVGLLYKSMLGLNALFEKASGNFAALQAAGAAKQIDELNKMTDEQYLKKRANQYTINLSHYQAATKKQEIAFYEDVLNEKIKKFQEADASLVKTIEKIENLNNLNIRKDFEESVAKNRLDAETAVKAEKEKKQAINETTFAVKKQSDEYERSYQKITEAIYKLTHTDDENREYDFQKEIEAYKKAGIAKVDIDAYVAASRIKKAQDEAKEREKIEKEAAKKREDAELKYYRLINDKEGQRKIETEQFLRELEELNLSALQKEQVIAKRSADYELEQQIERLTHWEKYYKAVGDMATANIMRQQRESLELSKQGYDKEEISQIQKSGNYNSLYNGLGATASLASDLKNRLNLINEFHTMELERIKEHYGLTEAEARSHSAAMAEIKRMEFEANVATASAGFGVLSDLAKMYYDASGGKSKEALRAYQVLAVAQAIMNTYLAASNAFASAGNPYLGAAMAALAIAQGMAQVAQIKQQKFHSGGLVGGSNDEVPALLQKGEYVISRKGVDALDAINNGNVSGGGDITIINVSSREEAYAIMQSRRGRAIINEIASK